ncbi:hypothetical protein ABKP09_14140 [Peribacillus frigoritolerans]|uniref:hypothetical protein n=1 Tax=Peribacillus frigoritolerans TaxID=450367 RepID=UPI0032B3843B
MTAVLIPLPAVLHAVLVRLELFAWRNPNMLIFSLNFKGVTIDMDDNELRKSRPVFVYANLENKKKSVQGLTEDRVKLIQELKKYRNVLSPFLIDVLQTNIDQWEIEIHDWQVEINKIEEEKESF